MVDPAEELLLNTLLVSETIHQVVVYQARGLEMGIDYGRAQELKSFLLHILRYAI